MATTMQRYRGPATLDMSFSGIAPNSTGRPGALQRQRKRRCFRHGTQSRGQSGFHVAGSELVGAKCRLSLHTLYERSGFRRSKAFSTAQRRARGDTNVVWENGLSDLEFNMVFTPLPNLVLSPGIRLSKSDIEITWRMAWSTERAHYVRNTRDRNFGSGTSRGRN